MNEKIAVKSKKSASLVRRLTLYQAGRMLRAFFAMDLLFCLVFLFAVGYQAEAAAAADIRGQAAGNLPLVAGFEKTEELAPAWGWRFPQRLEPHLAMPNGTRRSVSFAPAIGQWGLGPLLALRYELCVPTKILNHQMLYSVNIGPAVFWFGSGLAVLAALQIGGTLLSLPGISRSTRGILRPIHELTFVAQTMNASQQAAPTKEHLHLAGAIDQLNAITENHMDARISIEDEREELKGLASAINSLLDRLDAAYRSQLRFVSDASHELRTPIAVIQGYANMLDRWGKEDAGTLTESIGAIKAEAAHMKELVEQLLFLARSDNRSIVMEKNPVDISALAEEVLRETKMIDQSHTYAGRIEPDLLVRGDAQLLKQAMRIFVDNSMKYTPVGEEISLRVQARDPYVQISVTDNGIGIAAKDVPLVFERFYRSDESRARQTGGTGLGLSIAKWIVDEHGGIVEVTSRENIGTRVAFLLPNLLTERRE